MKQETQLTKRQMEFVKHYALSLNATEAAKKAGYSEKTAYSIGSENLKKPEIQKAIKEELDAVHDLQKKAFIRASDQAIKALIDVVKNGKGLSKVQAANSILDRAGHKPVERVQADVTSHDAISELPKDKQEAALLDAARSISGNIVAFGGAGGKK